MRSLHVVAFSKKLRWLAQTKVITLKTQLHAVIACSNRNAALYPVAVKFCVEERCRGFHCRDFRLDPLFRELLIHFLLMWENIKISEKFCNLPSISSTFCTRIFCTNVVSAAFL